MKEGDWVLDKGWIKTYRKIQDCWIWLDKEPFDKRSAWIDLLLSANHSDKRVLFNGELITVQRGQILTSIRKISEKWKWSYDKTLRFLKLIENDGMIQRDSDKFRTLLTIVNYEFYQDVPITDQTPISEQASEQASERASEQASERTSDKQECKEYKECKECKECKELKNNNNNISCAIPEESHDALEEFFEKIWKLYPIKKGKGSVSTAKKKVLQRIGYEEIERCVNRFMEDKKNTDKRYWMYGSTFFNSGYVDYLDKNYFTDTEPQEEVTSEEIYEGDDW